jgi:general secretion pathway protein A
MRTDTRSETRGDARAGRAGDLQNEDRGRPGGRPDAGVAELRGRFGFFATPFTREIRPAEQMRLPFFDEALDGLRCAVEMRSSAALFAPAGTGKTALLRRLLDDLPEARYQVRYVKVTSLSKRDMCREIAAACGVPPVGAFPFLVRALQERFEACYSSEGLRPVLLLDEAHDLRPDVLRMLRILTNFEMDSRLVLSVILSGQPPLKAMLARDDQEAITRRLSHCATLRLLSRDETASYITHRSTIAGAAQAPFDAAAVDALYELSRGNMRAIDQLALKALQAAARAAVDVVGTQHVLAARKDLL